MIYRNLTGWKESGSTGCLFWNTLEKKTGELSLVFTNDDYIAFLNREYRGRDEATDVLSFCQAEGETAPSGSQLYNAGDIVISVEYLEKNCRDFKVEENEELKRLLVHGLLHLAGWEHETTEPDEKMLVYQEKILIETGEKW